MKYKAALDQKGLELGQLSTSIQKKIKDVELYVKKINEIKLNNDGSISSEEMQKYEEGLLMLDRDAEKAILKFNIDSYLAQVDRLSKLREKKKTKQVIEQPKQEVHVEEPKEEPKKEEVIEDKIENLREEVSIHPERFLMDELDEFEDEHEPYEEPFEHEIAEFHKQGTKKQKKGSTSLIIMGIGAFILTWGAVNFFKERR